MGRHFVSSELFRFFPWIFLHFTSRLFVVLLRGAVDFTNAFHWTVPFLRPIGFLSLEENRDTSFSFVIFFDFFFDVPDDSLPTCDVRCSFGLPKLSLRGKVEDEPRGGATRRRRKLRYNYFR